MPRILTIPTIAAVLTVAVACGTAGAASPDGAYASKGAGPQTCERFVAEREKRTETYFRFLGWVEGYISYYNKVTPDTTDVLAWQTTELVDFLLNNFCKANVQKRFSFAVDSLVAALYPSRLRNTSDVVDVAGSNPPIQLYKDVVRRIQQSLTERGHYKGAVDGDYGPGTAAAIKAFQTANKLKETGVPDQVTLLRLFQ